jgi:iron complex transport system substrate-binding protein
MALHIHSFGLKARRVVTAHTVALCLSLAAGGAACSPVAERQSLDASEEAKRGPSVVSLNPCLDAILVELAQPEQILALSHYSRDPASSSMDPVLAARFEVTGGTAEEVLALQPDIVLASSFIDPATRAAFERLGVRVESFGSPTSVEESIAQIRRLADITGQVPQGDRLALEIERSLPDQSRPPISALLWQPGQIVPGEATLIDELLTLSGFVSHSRALGLDQADHVSLEKVLIDPPQVLLIAGDSAGQRHPLVNGQAKAMHIARFDPGLLYCGGPTIVRALARLDEIRAEYEARP